MKVTGNFIISDTINKNDRMYTEETLQDIKKQFEKKQPMFGELGFPDSSFTSLTDVSHKINSLSIKKERVPRKKKKQMKKNGTWKGFKKILFGEIELLDTPSGKLAQQLMKGLVCRPRAIGSVNAQGVVENCEIISFDLINKADDAFKGDL
jgi:hypothetical protein